MPVLSFPTYSAPFWLRSGHAQTLGPRIFCFVPHVPFVRERFELPDGDFLLLDWLFASGKRNERAKKLAILSHGLEGDSTRSYMRALALALVKRGWDVLSRNFRGCGGEMNRLPVLYHSGQIEDLEAVVRHAVAMGYATIALAGFSMGGNQVLKYLAERKNSLPGEIIRAAAISVPCDLTACSELLARPDNRIYMAYFLRTLRRKMREKHARYPQLFDISALDAMTTFQEFDDAFTAPLHGFADARDYWEKASCLPTLTEIEVRTLLINARNDPFLSESCFPTDVAEESDFLHLLMPGQGGHVGFPTAVGKTVGWLENTVADFLTA